VFATAKLLQLVEEVVLLDEALALYEVGLDLGHDGVEGIQHGVLSAHTRGVGFAIGGKQGVDDVGLAIEHPKFLFQECLLFLQDSHLAVELRNLAIQAVTLAVVEVIIYVLVGLQVVLQYHDVVTDIAHIASLLHFSLQLSEQLQPKVARFLVLDQW
jgi:hypothetical protein